MKKGELTSTQIMLLVISIMGFLIVLFFLFMNSDFFQSDSSEVCRFSVLARATASSALQGAVPLKCETKKICVSLNGGACKQFAGEKNVEVLVLDGKDDSEKALDLARVRAESMYECWNMMGEGKLDLFGSYFESRGLSVSNNICVICSRVALSDDVPKSILENKNSNLYQFLKNNYVPGTTITYLKAMTDEGAEDIPLSDGDYQKKLAERKGVESIGGLSEDLRQTAVVFSQIRTSSWKEKFGNLIGNTAVAAGGAFIAAPGSTLGKVIKLTQNPGTVLIGAAAVIGGEAAISAYNNAKSQQAVAGYCGQFTTNDEKGQSGCSLIQAVPYSVSNIKLICDQLEGTP